MVEENKGQVEHSELEKLRGPNSTLKLVEVIEGFVIDTSLDRWDGHFSSKKFKDNIRYPIMELQKWALPINQAIIETAAIFQPVDQVSLEDMVREMVLRGVISEDLSLIPPECFGKSILSTTDGWCVIQSLFGIRIDGLIKMDGDLPRLSLPCNYPGKEKEFAKIHSLDELISYAAQERGGLKDITETEDNSLRKIWDLPINQAIVKKVYSTATVIDGVSAIIIQRSALGHYLTLKLSPGFLASARPLTAESYREYGAQEWEKHLEWLAAERSLGSASILEKFKPEKRPTAQELYRQRYAGQMGAAINASYKFYGTEDQWMDRFPDNGEVPPWIWWEIYQRSRGRRV